MNKSVTILCTTALMLGFAVAATHTIRHSPQRPKPTGKVAPWDAMKIAEKKTGGHALTANFEFDDGHWIYGVMVVSKGHLKEVEVNATSGSISEVEDSNPAGEAKEVEHDLTQALKG